MTKAFPTHPPTIVSTAGLLILLFVMSMPLRAQNSYETPRSPGYETIERSMILYGWPVGVHSSIYPYRRGDMADLATYFIAKPKSEVQEFRLLQVIMDNNEFLTSEVRDYWKDESLVDSLNYDLGTREFEIYDSSGVLQYRNSIASKRTFLKWFYQTPAYFYELDTRSFYLRVNPMINFGFGKEDNDGDPLFTNQRGIELRGGIDGRVFFAANIVETQVRAPSHLRWWVDKYDSYPDAGLLKNYTTDILGFDDGYDYLMSEGYVGFNVSRHVGIHFGHGKNFIGDGYRSLFISDFAKNYFFLKFNTRVWKFHYQNIFAELADGVKESSDALISKKWIAAHYLSFQATPKLSFGLFESVVFDRESDQFEFQYLNPIILYRSVEHHLGSPDNVLLGFNARWDVFNSVRLYGQIMFDEFRFDELFGGNQWWGNKFAFQTGAKYINAFGIDQLDLQVEYNQSRPYTYSHRDSTGSYSHFNQPLAHPLGSNFQEFVFIGRYRPTKRISLDTRLFLISTSEDVDSISYGQNILRPNRDRNADYGIEQGQGVGVNTFVFKLQASYMIKQNLFLEGRYFFRNYNSEVDAGDLKTQYVSLGIRWNLFRDQTEF